MPPRGLPTVACALLIAAGAAWSAEDLVVDAERHGDTVEVRARALVAAPLIVVWTVLTDYERLPAFVPGISKSIVRERRGLRLRLEQSGEARFLLFTFPIEVELDVTESPPYAVVSRAVAGNLRRMHGRYELRPDPARSAVLVLYTGSIEPDFALPPVIGTAALRSTAEAQFAAMVAEIERAAASR